MLSKYRLIWAPAISGARQKLFTIPVALRTFLLIIGVALLYFLIANFSLLLAIKNTTSTPIWPASGFALAVLLLFGRQVWLGIALGTFATFFLDLLVESATKTTEPPKAFVIALALCLASTLPSLLSLQLLKLARVDTRFANVRDVILFWVVSALTSLGGSTIGTVTLLASDITPPDMYPLAWLTWGISNFVGVVTVTPLLLLWYREHPTRWDAKLFLRDLSLLCTTIVLSYLVFSGKFGLPIFLMPLILYAVFFCSQRTAFSALSLISIIAIIITIGGKGAFSRPSVNETLLAVQAFIAVITLTMMVFSAIVRERNDADMRLKDINAHLEETVFQRTQALTESHQRLDVLNGELAKSNNELELFAYTASHDLKAPLRGIDQLASWISDDLASSLDPNTQKHLSLMRVRINRMEKLLDDLLSYAQVGHVSKELVDVDSGHLVRNIFELLAPKIPMTLSVSADMPVFKTLIIPLELVFRNLLSNAIKHHDKAQGHISVSAARLEGCYQFDVRDDGPGIAPQHQSRVFELFKTLRPRDDVEGSGMGLAMVKKTVEIFTGSISVVSDGHSGSCFQFTWPDEERMRKYLDEHTSSSL